jgi:hypothetical protein
VGEAIARLREAGIKDPVLEKDLRSGGAGFHSARARIRSIESMLRPIAAGPPASGDVAAKLKGVLADPVYHHSGTNVEKTLGYQIGRWISERLASVARFFGRLLRGVSGALPGVGSALLWLALAVLAALAVIGAFVVGTRWHVQRGAAAEQSADVGQEYVSALASEWIRRAEQHAGAREWRLAVRCLYMATLARLDEAGLIHYDAGVTNWEYVRRVRRGGGERLMPALEPMTARFDCVWYGGAVTGEGEFRAAKDGYGDVAARCVPGAGS